MMSDTNAVCVKAKKKRKHLLNLPHFFSIADSFPFFPKIRSERITFIDYVLPDCFLVSLSVFAKQNCVCSFLFTVTLFLCVQQPTKQAVISRPGCIGE
jgi:hypothetical protein